MTAQSAKAGFGTRVLVCALILAGLLLFFGANAHLVYVALDSQPDCVPHFKDAEAANGGFRAAKSAC